MLRSLARSAIRKYERLTFRPYVAPDRRCGSDPFDFLIADPVAKAWYDTSPEQGLPEKLWCRDHIRPGFHAVDCGAHHGMMTVLFSKWVGGAGRVTCYEVITANRDVIRKNLALNKCSNVSIRPFGVGERNETILLDANLGNADVRRVQRTSKFAVVSLDSDLAGSTVDLLKLDV
jgi:FkbM family methyltransferase